MKISTWLKTNKHTLLAFIIMFSRVKIHLSSKWTIMWFSCGLGCFSPPLHHSLYKAESPAGICLWHKTPDFPLFSFSSVCQHDFCRSSRLPACLQSCEYPMRNFWLHESWFSAGPMRIKGKKLPTKGINLSLILDGGFRAIIDMNSNSFKRLLFKVFLVDS